ncbi:AIPR family protein [Pontiellaceae bacterium B12219]|nr:AIPR family protein [Pontiellaceae bacterium B12219]
MDDYYKNFMQDLVARSGADGNYLESVFTERMCDFLVEQAILQNYTVAEYKKAGGSGVAGVRLDAYNYNEETEVLSLIISDFRAGKTADTLKNTEIKKLFLLAERFLSNCATDDFFQSLEESTPGYTAAREISERRMVTARVQFFLVSNSVLSKSAKDIASSDKNWSYQVWDLGRIARIEESGKAREDMVVPFEDGIPCLPAFTGSENCRSFLLALPGELIASLYDEYGERLLEQNVRTFLQFRGKVNKGMRNTVQNEPEMFFAYNNGLTTTAEDVEFDTSTNTLKSITNLQIVNGGQTTASLFTSKRKHQHDLSKVYVQVKLTVITPSEVESVVPRISEYANTQNKVNAADFFSNHPFHLLVEKFSRRLWAPSSGSQETHWFYERARGQYANAYANMTKSKQNEFLRMNPKHQMFTKTDLAKYIYSFEQRPHIVSKGAQFCFAQFASDIGKKWEKSEKQFNELYFKSAIAKAIIFKSLDKQIMNQPWYGGYKANIVTYSLAKLSNMIDATGYHLDYLKIWQNQAISPAMNSLLLEIAEEVNETIQDTEANVTQYCKQELCWQKVQRLDIEFSSEVYDDLLGAEAEREQAREAERDQGELNVIEALTYVVEKGGTFWRGILEWNEETHVLSPKEVGILKTAAAIPNKVPSDAQAKILLKIESRAAQEGFVV